MRIRPEYAPLVLGSKVGCGVQGEAPLDQLDSVCDRVLCLDESLEFYLPRFGPRAWLRIVHDSGNWKDPRLWAEHCAIRMATAYRYGCRDLIVGNEQIALEGLSANPDAYRWLNEWGLANLAMLRQQLDWRGCPGVRVWGPALSPGHSEDDFFQGYRLLAPYLAQLDGIAVHNYWGPGWGFIGAPDAQWWAQRIVRAHALIEGELGIVKPWSITEYNRKVDRGDHGDIVNYASECRRYHAWTNSLDRVVAVFTFLGYNRDPGFDDLTWAKMNGMLDLMRSGWDRMSEGEWRNENPMDYQERLRNYADLWKRWGSGLNPEAAIARRWIDLAEGGRFIEPPVEPEHTSENGRYNVQAFTAGVLCYDSTTGAVSEGYPFA